MQLATEDVIEEAVLDLEYLLIKYDSSSKTIINIKNIQKMAEWQANCFTMFYVLLLWFLYVYVYIVQFKLW